ncbi:aspartate aminotransferase [bacterium]|nr:MAG: aspartate aminotransferase [bacterium]
MLALGEPDFDTPEFIKEAAKQAMDLGYTKYPPVEGLYELREAVVEWEKERGLEYTPDEVIITCGAKQGIFSVLFYLIEDEEVLIPSPYWVSYPKMVELVGGTPVFLDTAKEKLTPEILEKHITERTKVLILNSPSNPSGVVYSLDELEGIAEIIKKHDIFVISDEIYSSITYDGPAPSIGTIPGMKERTVVVSGVSKAFAMTGWRVGWVLAPQHEIQALKNIQSHMLTSTSSISQYAAMVALKKGKESVREMVEKFRKRRDLVVKLAGEIENTSFPEPHGAFYLFLDVSYYTKNTARLAEVLLEHGVAVVPGEAFGCPGYIRISYASSEEEIKKGMERIKRCLYARTF